MEDIQLNKVIYLHGLLLPLTRATLGRPSRSIKLLAASMQITVTHKAEDA